MKKVFKIFQVTYSMFNIFFPQNSYAPPIFTIYTKKEKKSIWCSIPQSMEDCKYKWLHIKKKSIQNDMKMLGKSLQLEELRIMIILLKRIQQVKCWKNGTIVIIFILTNEGINSGCLFVTLTARHTLRLTVKTFFLSKSLFLLFLYSNLWQDIINFWKIRKLKDVNEVFSPTNIL